jgi:hypothetical protein
MNSIVEILRKNDILGKKGPKWKTINALSLAKMGDLIQEVKEATLANHHQAKHSVFSFSASLGLGGGSSECLHLGCRLSRINALARFALMYSDEVFINNFLTDYNFESLSLGEDFYQTQRYLYDDLIVFQDVLPLIEQGYVKLFEPQRNLCFSCQAELFLGRNANKKFSENYERLKGEYLTNMHVECQKEFEDFVLKIGGPNPYFNSESIYILFDYTPEAFLSRPRILNQIQKGKVIQLSKSLTKDLELHTQLAHDVAKNAIYGLATSNALETSFLTEKELHIDFLNSLHGDPEIRERNSIALEHLESIVPFVGDVDLKDIVKLRKREEEAFIAYRQALNLAIKNFTSSKASFDTKEARALHADVIAPSLAVLDRKVKQAKRDLVKKPIRSLIGVVGAISFGLLTGLMSPNTAAIAETVGLVKFSADVIENVISISEKEKEIENDQFYFLWKLKKKSKK